jgi:hypothetical protein
MSKGILDIVKPGVLFGEDVSKVYAHAKEHGYALPAVNVVNTESINGVLEAAAKVNSPVIIQFSNGGASFYAGKGLSNEHERAAILGAVSGAIHTHMMAEVGDDYLFWLISEGGMIEPFNSLMPAWKQVLGEEERWQVIAYLRTLGK